MKYRFSHGHGRLPMVPVHVCNSADKEQFWPVEALIDSGSTQTVIPHWIAVNTGHAYEKGRNGSAKTLGGSMEGRVHTVDIKVFPMLAAGGKDVFMRGDDRSGEEVFTVTNIPALVRAPHSGPQGFAEDYIILGGKMLEGVIMLSNYPAGQFFLRNNRAFSKMNDLRWRLLMLRNSILGR